MSDTLVDEARREALLAVRRQVDTWGRATLGESLYELAVWPEVLMRRARAEIGYAHRNHEWGPERFALTFDAEDALLVHAAEHATYTTRETPHRLYGVPFDVGPAVEGYETPGRAWIMRHVSQQYLDEAGDAEIRGLLEHELDVWCRKAGLQRTEPPDLTWRKVAEVESNWGVVFEVTARAWTEPLRAPFLG